MIAPILGFVSFICTFVWLALMLFAQSLSGMGDGIGGGSSKLDLVIGYSGSVYLFLVFLSCLPFMRGLLLTLTGIVAHLILAVFVVDILAESGRQIGSWILILTFIAFALGWYALYKSRLKHS